MGFRDRGIWMEVTNIGYNGYSPAFLGKMGGKKIIGPGNRTKIKIHILSLIKRVCLMRGWLNQTPRPLYPERDTIIKLSEIMVAETFQIPYETLKTGEGCSKS